MLSIASVADAQTSAVIVFKGAQLIDGTGAPPIKKSVLVIEGDRITAVGKEGKVHYPKNARVIELEGRTIMPGIINGHGHLGLVVGTQNRADGYTRENVENAVVRYEQYGVTSMMSLGLNRDLVYELRDEQRRGRFRAPRFLRPGAASALRAARLRFLWRPTKYTDRDRRMKRGRRFARWPSIIRTSSSSGSTTCMGNIRKWIRQSTKR